MRERLGSWLLVISVAVAACGGGQDGSAPVDAPPAPPDAPAGGGGEPTLELIAGSIAGPGTKDGTGAAARFGRPTGLAIDRAGNLYVTDPPNNTIRKVTPDGTVTTLAGGGIVNSAGSADGSGAAARFNHPLGIVVDHAGNVFVSEFFNHTIRKITPAGDVTTFAGAPLERGRTDGPGQVARFNSPAGLAIDSADNLYVADFANLEIRKITPDGVVSTIAGFGNVGSADGPVATAQFGEPGGVAVDSAGTVYVADTENHTIRKIAGGTVTTLAGVAGLPGSVDGSGASARLDLPSLLTVDAAGNLYVTDCGNDTIRKVTPAGAVTTVAGRVGVAGNVDGTATAARFNRPASAVADAAGNVYVADGGNFEIRRIAATGSVTTIAGTAAEPGSADGAGTDARFGTLGGVGADRAGNVYVTDTSGNTIRRIDSQHRVSTIVGVAGDFGSTDGPRADARLNMPSSVTVDGRGNVFITDFGNGTIRALSPAGAVTTVAGSAGLFGSDDGLHASFESPNGIAFDGSSTLYVTDLNNETIRALDLSTERVRTIAGTVETIGHDDGLGLAATFNGPAGIAVDAMGNVYVADTGNGALRKIAPGGQVTTLAVSASFHVPLCVTIDTAGNLYVADLDATIRKVTPDGTVTTLAGTAGVTGVVLGASPQLATPSGLAILGDSLVISDGHAVLLLRHVVR